MLGVLKHYSTRQQTEHASGKQSYPFIEDNKTRDKYKVW